MPRKAQTTHNSAAQGAHFFTFLPPRRLTGSCRAHDPTYVYIPSAAVVPNRESRLSHTAVWPRSQPLRTLADKVMGLLIRRFSAQESLHEAVLSTGHRSVPVCRRVRVWR